MTINGKVYGLPHARRHYMGIIFRIDLVRAAGLDPNKPPRTWDEFIYWCQKLTDPNKKIPGAALQRGQRGFAIAPYGWHFLPWLLVGPALVLIGLWSYYPLLRGMVMAFEDYRITGTSPFVGLDNFITLALDRSFWVSLGRTVYFVVLNMTPLLSACLERDPGIR